VFIEDTLANKYKENPREQARQRRHQQLVKEAEAKFQKRLDDWSGREAAKERTKAREKEREIQKDKERQDLIKKDMEFDEIE